MVLGKNIQLQLCDLWEEIHLGSGYQLIGRGHLRRQQIFFLRLDDKTFMRAIPL